MTTDTWNVTASWVYPTGQTSYNAGQTMKVQISGGDVLTTTSVLTATATVNVVADDGSTTTVTTPPTSVNVTTTTPESVKITSVTDSGNRTWTVDASGLFATATA